MIKQTEFIIDRLTEWENGDYSNLPKKRRGICLNLTESLKQGKIEFNEKEILNQIKDYSQSWSQYSGYLLYPIPSDTVINYPWSCYWENASSHNKMWVAGQYAEWRRDLCRHLANKFRQKL